MEQDKAGWWEVKVHEKWCCPKCKEASPVEDWKEYRPYCEDCGDHDGRECPKCGWVADMVWDVEPLEEATKRYEAEQEVGK